MAQGTTTKITQISKDLNMKSKDVIDAFRLAGIEKKNGGSADGDEFGILMEHLMLAHQIKDIDGYLKGSVTITGTKPKVEEQPKPAEEKTPDTPQVKEAQAAPKPADAQQKAPPAARPAQETRPQKPQPGQKPAGDAAPKAGTTFTFHPDGHMDERRGENKERREGDARRTDNRQRPNPTEKYRPYRDRPQDDPFAKRRAEMNRAAEGLRKPGQPVARPATPAPQQAKPAAKLTALEQRQAEQQKRQAAQLAQAQAQAQKKPPKKEEKKQKQQFKTITPSVDQSRVTGGVNLSGEYTSDTAPKTRVVDMRTSDVNLSRYDDHFNDRYYAIVNGTDAKSSPAKQKLKKQDNRGQNQKTAKDKEKAARERMKRIAAEQARQKQLQITVPDEITVGELAMRLKKASVEVVKKLMLMGDMKTVNDTVDFATAELIADAFGAKVTKEIVITKEERLFTEAEDDADSLIERAPVVCVMGHVDHGKTSILDAIRHTNVTKGEAGGITQAIGAYRVKVNGKDITFLDTPGHEAFTAMRMRGAQSTDIAILVVAADDGVMPQTIEAINHAKAAGIDIIVAINKMDKPHANPDNVLNQLTQYELVPEAWGGDVICVPVSALTGMGITDLLDSVLLVAEVKELRANPKRRAKGIVIESKLDRGRGPVATVLVQNGTLHQGDYVIVGDAVGRVRAMIDDKGKKIKEAGPSVPAEIVGLDAVPQAGDEMNAVEDEKMAKSLAADRREKARQDLLNANARVNLDELFSQISDGVKTLNIIVKADVAGSAEAVRSSLLKLSGDEVKVSVIHTGVGGITESDVMLAAASNAIIVGFNVRPDKNALDSAERNQVDIRTHRIIYEIIDEIEAAMKGMLAPTYKENLLGHAEVRQCIHVPNVGTIAGSYIQDGKITRQSQIRVVRDGVVIFEDQISSLRRFKDDVREVASGYECGVGLEKFNDIKVGDILEAFIMEEVKR